MLPLRLVVLSAACLCLPEAARAAVVEDAVQFGSGGSLGDYSMLVFQDAGQSDPTSVWVDFSYAPATTQITLTGTNMNLDQGSDWYFTRAGDVFDAATIASDVYPLIIGVSANDLIVGNPVTFSPLADFAMGLEDGLDDFYLGVATGDTLPSQGLGRTVFGWLKLRLVTQQFMPPRLEYIDSAVSYGQGIVIGTLTAVPEPTPIAMISSISLCSLMHCRFRRNPR